MIFLRSLLLDMNILVMGAAGMVGRKLCDALAKSGDSVRTLIDACKKLEPKLRNGGGE